MSEGCCRHVSIVPLVAPARGKRPSTIRFPLPFPPVAAAGSLHMALSTTDGPRASPMAFSEAKVVPCFYPTRCHCCAGAGESVCRKSRSRPGRSHSPLLRSCCVALSTPNGPPCSSPACPEASLMPCFGASCCPALCQLLAHFQAT